VQRQELLKEVDLASDGFVGMVKMKAEGKEEAEHVCKGGIMLVNLEMAVE
jgi:hypothetical protein